ncbi:MAG: FAD-dependent monooxygenase [Betaproteobacteria bacterium]|nr:FAD-dependent monooxygenase [Betaproteobacteria bacterium]
MERADIVIVGAGPVGMVLALALAGGPYRVVLTDNRPRGASAADPRVLALSHGTRQLLERLAAWNAQNAAAATPINDIHISQRGGFGRTVIDRKDYGVPALGYVMRYRDLAAALSTALDRRAGGAQVLDNCTVETVGADGEGAVTTVTRNGEMRRIASRLVVHAEGTPHDDRDDPGVGVSDYRQHAIIAEVRPAPVSAYRNRAWERFTPDGPLALLPLGDGYSVVFAVPPARAAELLQTGDEGFLAALRAQFGGRLDFVSTGPRASFPLALRVRRQLVQTRQVWVGNSAQTLHPVSGQGFNLGLRDAWELAETLLVHAGDAGDPAPLARYARGRSLDRSGSTAFTDGIVRLFSNDLPPLRWARGIGLLALDLAPPLRNFIARRMIWGARAWP